MRLNVRRSRPQIIEGACRFGPTIQHRLDKTMEKHGEASGETEVVCWTAEQPENEACVIAQAIRRTLDQFGYRYNDAAILCRGRMLLPTILEALRAQDVTARPRRRAPSV